MQSKKNYEYDEDCLVKKSKKQYEDNFDLDLNSFKGKSVTEIIERLKENEEIQ